MLPPFQRCGKVLRLKWCGHLLQHGAVLLQGALGAPGLRVQTPSYSLPLSSQRWSCHLLQARPLLLAESPWSLLFSFWRKFTLFFDPPHDTIFSLFPLGNSPNFFNNFSFYKCPEESLASNNFNSLFCISYWGKEIPQAQRCVWNGKGKIEKEQI